MTTEVLMPALSPSSEEATLAKWHVEEGAEVKAGDVIAEIGAGSATMEVEAAGEGRLARILVSAGTERVKVNTPIAVIEAREDGAPEREDAGRMHQSAGGAPENLRTAPGPIEAPQHVVIQTAREALRDAIAEEMRRDPGVFVIGFGVATPQDAYRVTAGLADEFGARRVIDTPVAEHGLAGLAVGAAFAGLKPVVEFLSWNFAMQAMDQIVNSAAKTFYMSGGTLNCPIVLRGQNGFVMRAGAQHAQCFSAWYAHVPGLKVVVPSTPADAKGLLKAAIRDPNPVVFLEHDELYSRSGAVPREEDRVVPIGTAHVVREGRDITLVSFGRAMAATLEAAGLLATDGIEAEAIDLRTLRPLDLDTVLASVRKTGRLVTVEDAWPVCSIGSELCAAAATHAFGHLLAAPAKVSGADVPMPYAANLEALALPTAAQVVAAARAVLRGGKGLP